MDSFTDRRSHESHHTTVSLRVGRACCGLSLSTVLVTHEEIITRSIDRVTRT
jgi:hypothetical protein